jgi:hypothetical protein
LFGYKGHERDEDKPDGIAAKRLDQINERISWIEDTSRNVPGYIEEDDEELK